MSPKYLLIAGLVIMPGIAHAADDAEERPLRWSVGVDGGVSVGGGQGSQPSVALNVTRSIGESYVRLSVSQITADTNNRNFAFVPATTRQVRVSGGLALGDFTLEGYAGFGDRAFSAREIRRFNGQIVSISSSGTIAGGGASMTYDWALSDTLFLSPYVAIDYSSVTTARVINLTGAGAAAPILQNQTQRGITGSAGVSVQKLFGLRSQHAIALNGSVVTTSNNASVNRSNATGATAEALNILQGGGISDTWGEIGGVASFGLTRRLSFTFNVVRTIGLSFGNITTGSGGLRFAF